MTELTDKHIENLKVLAAEPGGILKSRLPHPRCLPRLIREGLAEANGFEWIATAEITRQGRNWLRDNEA